MRLGRKNHNSISASNHTEKVYKGHGSEVKRFWSSACDWSDSRKTRRYALDKKPDVERLEAVMKRTVSALDHHVCHFID